MISQSKETIFQLKQLTNFDFLEVRGSKKVIKDIIILKLSKVHLIHLGQFMKTLENSPLSKLADKFALHY